jgi:hypothetical protein
VPGVGRIIGQRDIQFCERSTVINQAVAQALQNAQATLSTRPSTPVTFMAQPSQIQHVSLTL